MEDQDRLPDLNQQIRSPSYNRSVSQGKNLAGYRHPQSQPNVYPNSTPSKAQFPGGRGQPNLEHLRTQVPGINEPMDPNQELKNQNFWPNQPRANKIDSRGIGGQNIENKNEPQGMALGGMKSDGTTQLLTDRRADQQRTVDRDSPNQRGKRSANTNEDQFFKKQMEFKGGKRHQLITDQIVNTNKIYANRYQGLIGVWYFTIDCVYHFENLLALLLFAIILYSEKSTQISAVYPIVTLTVNISLMAIRNITFELRQRKITNKINDKMLSYLNITVKSKRFQSICWAEVEPGQIIKVRSGQEFPADCLILDIQAPSGSTAQRCYVTSGPFDDAMGIIRKRSYAGTTNKTGSKQNETHFAEMISGLLKFEYNYFGYIMGSFKLNENPASIEFDYDNVVQRGALLTHSPEVVCLVLNVGDQCMGSPYKDPKSSLESQTNQKLKSFVKTQRRFDKAYKQSIRVILIGLSAVYLCLSGLGVYLASNPNFFHVSSFEKHIIKGVKIDPEHYFEKGLGFYAVLFSSLPLSFPNIIDLLVLMSTNFAEWDINVTPAKINFIYPHATLAFGKVAHMFFSRLALQRDDKQSVKIFHIGGHFFKNQVSQLQQDRLNVETSGDSYGELNESDHSRNYSKFDELSLDYLPNELRYTNQFYNEEADQLLNGEDTLNKRMLVEFFRGITLCHQASVRKIQGDYENGEYKYIGVLNDEIATLDFCQQQDFKLVQRKKKYMTIILQGKQERYEELGVVTTKALMGHFMTICAVRIQGEQAGVLYMKGSIATLKQYFVEKESDFQYLNDFEYKFIQAGVQSIVYAKRQLTIEETNQLIITINEGVQMTKENNKLDNLLYNLSSVQLEILGILGLQKSIHLRNRVVVDEMILNGVKPWIISKEDEQSHLTALNSLKVFEGCQQPLMISGTSERVVMEQIQSALKTITERMGQKSQRERSFHQDCMHFKDADQDEPNRKDGPASDRGGGAKNNNNTGYKKFKGTSQKMKNFTSNEKITQDKQQKDNQAQRNVVVFTGRALVEIMRDQTMIKSFITLAYISNMMIGSEITPIQKQHLLKMVRNFIGEGEYAAAIVTTPEDQFMINEADLCANLKSKGKSADFEAVVDVTLKDFSAISYLLFKHGNHIQMRLSKAAQAFFYRSLISFLILTTYMVNSGFSGAIPYTASYYDVFMIFLAPLQILIYAIFFKDYGYDYFYRIYGHYNYNFSFTLVETEYLVLDYMCAFFDWVIIYLPFELADVERHITTKEGRNVSREAYNCYQVILMQIIFFQYFRNTNMGVIYATTLQFFFMLIGLAMIFDDGGLVGAQQLFSCPSLMLTLLFQALLTQLRNTVCSLMSKLVIRKYADLLDWYRDIEERLAFEEYEDINQTFAVSQFKPLYQKINSSNIQRTLTLINKNMMKIPKPDSLEQILENINNELDIDRRGQVTSGFINKWNLQLNDLNKEAEYQDNKNQREIVYVRRQLLIFIITTLLFSLFGLTLYIFIEDFTNIGIYYYLGLSALSFFVYWLLPRMYVYLSRTLLIYTLIVIFCYTIYTSGSESLQPAGLIFVLALVAGLNHSYIYPTIIMIMASVIMFNFFSFFVEDEGLENSGLVNLSRSFVWFFTGIVWSAYVYMQELEKKTQFVSGHRMVRNFAKLKQILDILVPSLVRDKIRSGQKNFSEIEGEVSIIYFDISQFDSIVQSYTTKELLNFLDQVYNVFDQLCDQYGLQKIETVGKTYMACGGLKSADRKIDQRLLNRHFSVRVTDFAMECVNYVKSRQFLKSGKNLELKIGIHTGPVIAGVVGETKPQFSLIGDTVHKASNICQLSEPLKVSVSSETIKYLELYTNNLSFWPINIQLDNNKKEKIYYVSISRGRIRSNMNDKDKNLGRSGVSHTLSRQDDENDSEGQKQGPQLNEGDQMLHQRYQDIMEMGMNGNNDSGDDQQQYQVGGASFSSVNSFYSNARDALKSHRQLLDEQDYEFENDSNKSGMIDEGTMNVFGFNDDLNLDDRAIAQNATQNNTYFVVERPRFLIQFDQKDLEKDFLFHISKQESSRTTMYLVLLIILNKIIVLGDQLLDGKFSWTPQFILMFPVFGLELLLCNRVSNPQYGQIYIWTFVLHLYGLIVLTVLLSLQVKYLGKWTQAGFNELQIQLAITLMFFMRNILFRYFILTYAIYMISWIFTVTGQSEEFSYQIIQFIIGQIMYAILLAIGIHHREGIQRKSFNYERILTIETNKTSDLISKLVPFHMLSAITSGEQRVDEFDGNLTLLYTDMIGFNNFSQNVKDPREIVLLLSRLFTRFDQLCEENRVYKVYTFSNKYVIMGYNGRIEKNRRSRNVVLEEANRVIQTGLEMIDTIREYREQSQNVLHKTLDMRVGIHTGKVIAGIIGSKVVRYDIFGEGVLIANKIERHGIPGKVCISEDTRKLIMSQPDTSREYTIEDHKRIDLPMINRSLMSYTVERNEESRKSYEDSNGSYANGMLSQGGHSSFDKYNQLSHRSSQPTERQGLLKDGEEEERNQDSDQIKD